MTDTFPEFSKYAPSEEGKTSNLPAIASEGHAMSKPNNSSIVYALRLARNRIRRHRWGFICWVLEGLADDGKVSYVTAGYIQKLIQSRLGKAKTYNNWVRVNHPEIESAQYWRGRVQWLDALIVEHGGTP